MARLPSGVFRRKDGLLEKKIVVNGFDGRMSVYGHTTTELAEKEEKKRKEINEGLYTANANITLNQLFDEWKAEKEKAVGVASLEIYETNYRLYIRANFGKKKVRAIERRQIVKFMQKIAQKHSDKTANRCKGLIYTLLKYALQNEIVSRNVAQDIPLIKTEKSTARDTIHRELTEQEIRTFFEYCKKSVYRPAFLFMLNTGVRASECLALQWCDISTNVIHIRRTMTKGKKGQGYIVGKTTKTRAGKRDIPINGAIKAILDSQLALYKATHNELNLNDPVFPRENGSFGDVATLNTTIRNTLKRINKAGITFPHFSSHAFRDTFASRAYRSGMPGNVLKEIMGHESYAMTMDLYSHISIDDKSTAMDKLVTGSFITDKKESAM